MGDFVHSQTFKEAAFFFALLLLLAGFKVSVEGLME